MNDEEYAKKLIQEYTLTYEGHDIIDTVSMMELVLRIKADEQERIIRIAQQFYDLSGTLPYAQFVKAIKKPPEQGIILS